MDPLDLQEYEWKIRVRQLTMDDYDALVAMQEKCFPGMATWKREHLESQLAIFPEGQLCIEIDGQLAASSSSLILKYSPSLEWHNWRAVSDNGFIRNHNPKGDTLYGIEIMVDPEFRGMKLSRRLVRCPQGNLPASEPRADHHRRPDPRLSQIRRQNVRRRVRRARLHLGACTTRC